MGLYGWHDNNLKAEEVQANALIVSSGTEVLVDADSWTHGGQGLNLRYIVTDWASTHGQTLTQFQGMYLRTETREAGNVTLRGAEIYGVCNNVTMGTGNLWGTLTYAYVKGVAAVTIKNMYAVQGELTWDASRTGDCTITTAAACFRAKITGGRVANYTKIHGYELTIGEMDGDSAKFGKGLFMQDDSGMSGTCTLTTGIDITIGCTTGISIGGATTDALSISGDATTAINVTSGCSPTNALLIAGATTDAIKITGDASSAGILMSSTCTPPYGIKLENACTTAGFEVAAACAKGIEISGACTTSGIDVAADCQIGLDIGAQTTASIIVSGASVDGLKIDADMTRGINLTSNVTATDGILIAGACADGIEISGACTSIGMNISGTCPTGISLTNASTVGLLISAGPMGFDLTSTLPAGAAANANEINFTDNSTGDSGYARALWINAVIAGDKTVNGEHNSFGIDQYVTGNTPYLYGMTYYSYDTGDPEIGFAAPISIYQDDLGTNLGAWVGIDIGSNFTNAPAGRHAFLRCRNHNAAAVPNCIIQCEGSGGATFLVDIDTQANMLSASSGATTVVEKIAVKTPGGTRYLKLYSDV